MSTDLLFFLGNLKKASFYVIHFRKSGNGQIRHISQISRSHLESRCPDTQLSCSFYQNITISSDCMDILLWRATIFSHKTLSATFPTQSAGGGNYCVHIALNECLLFFNSHLVLLFPCVPSSCFLSKALRSYDSSAMLILKCEGMKHLLSWQALRTFIFEWEGWEIDLEVREDKKTQVIFI